MEALQNKLECFNRELRQEIVEDYEQHFAEGIAAGKTEEFFSKELSRSTFTVFPKSINFTALFAALVLF